MSDARIAHDRLPATNADEQAAGLAPTPGYRYADVAGDQLFVAGQVPLVEVHRFGLADVRQLTVYVVGPHQHLLDAWAAVNEWFDGNVSPATLLGVHLLGYPEQLVEIDATIVRTDARPA